MPSLRIKDIGKVPIWLARVGLTVKVGSRNVTKFGSVVLPACFTVRVTEDPSMSCFAGRVRLEEKPTATLIGPIVLAKVGALFVLMITEKTVLGELKPSVQVTSMG